MRDSLPHICDHFTLSVRVLSIRRVMQHEGERVVAKCRQGVMVVRECAVTAGYCVVRG